MSGEFTITEKAYPVFRHKQRIQEMCEKNGFENLGNIFGLPCKRGC